jgi:hypothetical protein
MGLARREGGSRTAFPVGLWPIEEAMAWPTPLHLASAQKKKVPLSAISTPVRTTQLEGEAHAHFSRVQLPRFPPTWLG